MAQGMTNPRGHQGFRDEGGGGASVTGDNVVDGVVEQGFDLYLSFGQGTDGTDNNLPTDESFWLGPQVDADHATVDQAREWPTDIALHFVKLLVYIDDAGISGETGVSFIVTLNGADTPISVSIPAGVTTGAELSIGAFLEVAANSRLGVRVDGSGVTAGSKLRCEARLIGSQSGTPTTPTALPSDPLALYPSSALAASGESWDDTTGNGFGLGVPPVLGARRPDVLQNTAFNGNRYAHFGTTATDILATETEMFPGHVNPVEPRTFAAVIRPTNATGGTVGCFRLTADYFSCALWKTAGNQYAYENGDANNSLLSSVIDYGGDELVCVWVTDGVSVTLYVDGVARAAATNAVGPETGVAPGFSLGNMLAHFGDRGFEGDICFAGVWARAWDNSEILSGTAYLAETYVTP